jgi:hypothetical protein
MGGLVLQRLLLDGWSIMFVWSSIWWWMSLALCTSGCLAGSIVRSRGLGYGKYVSGLVAGLERENGWRLAEHAGEVARDGMQRLLRRADWDIDGVRDDVRDYVIDRLGESAGVLVVDLCRARDYADRVAV